VTNPLELTEMAALDNTLQVVTRSVINESWAVAARADICMVVPTGREDIGDVTATDATRAGAGGVTTMAYTLRTVKPKAVIVAFPADRPCATPVPVTDATAALLLTHPVLRLRCRRLGASSFVDSPTAKRTSLMVLLALLTSIDRVRVGSVIPAVLEGVSPLQAERRKRAAAVASRCWWGCMWASYRSIRVR
jgi:hypothetical protein